MYFWSNKCSLGEQKRLLSKPFKNLNCSRLLEIFVEMIPDVSAVRLHRMGFHELRGFPHLSNFRGGSLSLSLSLCQAVCQDRLLGGGKHDEWTEWMSWWIQSSVSPPSSQQQQQQHITHTAFQRASAITETLNMMDHLHKTTWEPTDQYWDPDQNTAGFMNVQVQMIETQIHRADVV